MVLDSMERDGRRSRSGQHVGVAAFQRSQLQDAFAPKPAALLLKPPDPVVIEQRRAAQAVAGDIRTRNAASLLD